MAQLNRNAAPQKQSPPLDVTILEYKEMVRGDTMKAILVVALNQVGVKMHSCTYHVRAADNKRWVGLPARQYEAKGQKKWAVLVEALDSSAHWRLQHAILKAVDCFLGESQERPAAHEADASDDRLY